MFIHDRSEKNSDIIDTIDPFVLGLKFEFQLDFHFSSVTLLLSVRPSSVIVSLKIYPLRPYSSLSLPLVGSPHWPVGPPPAIALVAVIRRIPIVRHRELVTSSHNAARFFIADISTTCEHSSNLKRPSTAAMDPMRHFFVDFSRLRRNSLHGDSWSVTELVFTWS